MKWRQVDVLATLTPTQADRDKWSAQWTEWKGISMRFNKAAELMVGKNFDSFLLLNPGPITKLAGKYPDVPACASPKEFFISGLFTNATGGVGNRCLRFSRRRNSSIARRASALVGYCAIVPIVLARLSRCPSSVVS
jgi:hypothetical protein